MEMNIPGLIEAIALLVVVLFIAHVLLKLGKLIDKFSDRLDRRD